MSQTLYPIHYGTRLVTFDILVATFEPHIHPEFAKRGFNFIKHNGGKFGIGGGRRLHGNQPNKPGFAPEGRSFHQDQNFPSGRFYSAWDLVVVNPGHVHRAPNWSEVPKQGSQMAKDYGVHMNVGNESWHMQSVEIDGWGSWVRAGRPDMIADYPFVGFEHPRPQPPQPPVPENPDPAEEITVQFESRYLKTGVVGSDVKFYQRQLNEIAGQGLIIDGHYGSRTAAAVSNWQKFFGLHVDGEAGPKTQQSIIEVTLLSS